MYSQDYKVTGNQVSESDSWQQFLVIVLAVGGGVKLNMHFGLEVLLICT